MATPVTRRAEENDAEAVAALLRELGYSTTVDEVGRRIAVFDHSHADHALVAVVDSEVVGLVTVNVAPLLAEGGSFARITSLVVREQRRGAGIGRRLLAEAEGIGRRAGCALIQVSSGKRPERVAAHRFYADLGYADAAGHHTLYEKRLRT